jgi:hypothetical protein
MDGKYSIKNVLPALSDDLSYDQLDISDGSMAMNAFAALQNMTDPDEIKKTRGDLLKYCLLDTLSMVEILDKLKEL